MEMKTDNRLEAANLVFACGVAAASDPRPASLGALAAHDTLHDLVEQGDALAIGGDGSEGLVARAVDAHGLLGELEGGGECAAGGRRACGRSRGRCLRGVGARRGKGGRAAARGRGERLVGRAWEMVSAGEGRSGRLTQAGGRGGRKGMGGGRALPLGAHVAVVGSAFHAAGHSEDSRMNDDGTDEVGTGAASPIAARRYITPASALVSRRHEPLR
jgi:hypothetical protein